MQNINDVIARYKTLTANGESPLANECMVIEEVYLAITGSEITADAADSPAELTDSLVDSASAHLNDEDEREALISRMDGMAASMQSLGQTGPFSWMEASAKEAEPSVNDDETVDADSLQAAGQTTAERCIDVHTPEGDTYSATVQEIIDESDEGQELIDYLTAKLSGPRYQGVSKFQGLLDEAPFDGSIYTVRVPEFLRQAAGEASHVEAEPERDDPCDAPSPQGDFLVAATTAISPCIDVLNGHGEKLADMTVKELQGQGPTYLTNLMLAQLKRASYAHLDITPDDDARYYHVYDVSAFGQQLDSLAGEQGVDENWSYMLSTDCMSVNPSIGLELRVSVAELIKRYGSEAVLVELARRPRGERRYEHLKNLKHDQIVVDDDEAFEAQCALALTL